MGEVLKNIKAIREKISELKEQKYAFNISYLQEQEEYVKNLYIKILCSIIEFENDPTEHQIMIIKRIFNGISLGGSIEEYMRKALDLSENDIQEFLSYAGETELKYYFALDALLLTVIGNGNENEEAYRFIAEIFEVLGLKKSDLDYIVLVAKAILLQKSEYYNAAIELKNENFDGVDFSAYIKNFYTGVILDTKEIFHYCSFSRTTLSDIQFEKNYCRKKVIFENVDITLTSDLHFESCEDVIFENCRFVGDAYTIYFESCKNIKITNSIFENFNSYTLWEDGCGTVNIDNCEFENCMLRYRDDRTYKSTWEVLGGVIHTTDAERNGINYIIKSTFKKCGGINNEKRYATAFVSNCDCIIIECKFYQCWHYHKGKNLDPDSSARTMFLPNTENENNEIIGSANLTQQ